MLVVRELRYKCVLVYVVTSFQRGFTGHFSPAFISLVEPKDGFLAFMKSFWFSSFPHPDVGSFFKYFLERVGSSAVIIFAVLNANRKTAAILEF